MCAPFCVATWCQRPAVARPVLYLKAASLQLLTAPPAPPSPPPRFPPLQLNENLTYSEKLLMYMRMCCLCFLCDSCTGADPEYQREQRWQRQARR